MKNAVLTPSIEMHPGKKKAAHKPKRKGAMKMPEPVKPDEAFNRNFTKGGTPRLSAQMTPPRQR
jgi:hypothetical protein